MRKPWWNSYLRFILYTSDKIQDFLWQHESELHRSPPKLQVHRMWEMNINFRTLSYDQKYILIRFKISACIRGKYEYVEAELFQIDISIVRVACTAGDSCLCGDVRPIVPPKS
uniref:Uncharacterized protein n=1 Tax=Nelumbo nucifera TaxID=4432 RepID=A0A822ZML3_NELNU|nr:TPA_asm: hypothetical protein HUJ06_002426 [Nelumbo nucifera]